MFVPWKVSFFLGGDKFNPKVLFMEDSSCQVSFPGGGCDHTLEYLKSEMFIGVLLLNMSSSGW